MKVELHLHTMRYSGCAINTPQEMMQRLIETGYQAVYITEHDAVWTDWELEALRKVFPGIRVFPGVELSLGGDAGQHVLVLGTNDAEYLDLRTADEVVKRARQDGHLVVLAHPFRWRGSSEMLWNGVMPDALEYRTNNHDFDQASESETAAEKLKLPLVNAGDVHTLGMINRYWIQTRRPLEKADDIRQIVLDGEYENCTRTSSSEARIGG